MSAPSTSSRKPPATVPRIGLPTLCAAPARAAMATIARYTVLEVLRNHLLWVALAVLAAGIGLAAFVSAIALTETRETQVALLAAALRLAAVVMLAAFVVTGMAREAADKTTHLLLALPIPRTAWLVGKLAGYCAAALLPAALFGALIAFMAAPAQAALWTVSLICELWLVVACAVFCTVTLSRAVPALATVAGFYLLSRSLGIFELLGHAPSGAAAPRAIGTLVDAIALLLPRLDQFTQAGWLLYDTGSVHALAHIAAQTAIYLLLLAAAAAFDLHRREF